jgi:hypothetical protein
MKFEVSVSWTMTATMIVGADSKEEADNLVREMNLPTDGEYLDDSFNVDEMKEIQ